MLTGYRNMDSESVNRGELAESTREKKAEGRKGCCY